MEKETIMNKEENNNPEETTSDVKVDDLPLTKSDPQQIKGGVRVQVPTGTVTF
jgi:hypothetical protein